MLKGQMLIAVEGVSGSGKSMLRDMVAAALRQRGMTVGVMTCFSCERIDDYCRGLIMTRQWSHSSDRNIRLLQFLSQYESELEQSASLVDVIVVEKYFYHYGALADLSVDAFRSALRLHAIVDADLIVYLDRSPEDSYAALRSRRPIMYYETGMWAGGRAYENLVEFTRGGVAEATVRDLFATHQGKLAMSYERILAAYDPMVIRVKGAVDGAAEDVVERTVTSTRLLREGRVRTGGGMGGQNG